MNKQSALEQIKQAAFEEELEKISAIPFPWVNNPERAKKEIKYHQDRIEKIKNTEGMSDKPGSFFRKMQERKIKASEDMINRWKKS